MARNSSGTYSLPSAAPAANPVITGTTITSDWANGTLGDISTELTDSLSRTGKGGMTAPLRTADGTVAAPSVSFTSETGSGWFRNAAGELRLAILGVYRIAVTATTVTVNAALTAIGKITASAGLDVTGTLAVIDDGGTSKKVTVDAPTGLAADYALTLPTALPGSTLPVTMTSAGVLSTGQLTNAQQNFGTPSASTDVVIKSFTDQSTSNVTSPHANLGGTPVVGKMLGLAYFPTVSANALAASGNLTDSGDTMVGGDTLFIVPSGYRPANDILSGFIWYDQSAASGAKMKQGFVRINASNGNVTFHIDPNTGGTPIVNTDIVYYSSIQPWSLA